MENKNLEELIPILKKEIQQKGILDLLTVEETSPVYQASSDIHGMGVFTPINLEADKFIGITHTFYKGMWYQVFPLGVFYNHSKNPNCVIEVDNNVLVLKTMGEIKRNEELTVDYTKQPYLEQPKGDWVNE